MQFEATAKRWAKTYPYCLAKLKNLLGKTAYYYYHRNEMENGKRNKTFNILIFFHFSQRIFLNKFIFSSLMPSSSWSSTSSSSSSLPSRWENFLIFLFQQILFMYNGKAVMANGRLMGGRERLSETGGGRRVVGKEIIKFMKKIKRNIHFLLLSSKAALKSHLLVLSVSQGRAGSSNHP